MWTAFSDEPETVYLTVSHSKFAVGADDAGVFLEMRSHCTGHNTVSQIAEKSGLGPEKVAHMVASLAEAGVLRPSYRYFSELSQDEIRRVLFAACRIWSEQLAETSIALDIRSGLVARRVVLGWLLETYHYIKAFPGAIQHAAAHASGELRGLLERYAAEERGHELYVARTLEAAGLTRAEIESSIPLVSTRLIDLLMRDLFTDQPIAALLVAAIVEADEIGDEDLRTFREATARHYGLGADALAPLQEHMKIDARLGHAELAARHAHLVVIEREDELHDLVNKLHDLKHAFDVQKLEIKEYYSRPGNYFPRQFVDFFAI
ncbi:iron-containing redox enzyme family protein [Sorangium sp. So ce1078]|uniref:iron-containing redox enzyme family protein n=1 Tax=Sorangium sp. So ce1078 TaxID=3133329 RepID=UPI003F6151DD